MRVKKEIIEIDYNKTKQFFGKRSEKYNEKNPYSVTMYQDNDIELVKRRNEIEQQKIIPFLNLNSNSKILDIACGIGRWADAINQDVNRYLGIDFSKELIDIATQRNKKTNFYFEVGTTSQIIEVIKKKEMNDFSVVIISGILLYLNEIDMRLLLESLNLVCADHATIYIREPIAQQSRLTLKNFYSEELDDDYNAIYRSIKEYKESIYELLLTNGFNIKTEDFLFETDKELNNRKETVQYYFIIER